MTQEKQTQWVEALLQALAEAQDTARTFAGQRDAAEKLLANELDVIKRLKEAEDYRCREAAAWQTYAIKLETAVENNCAQPVTDTIGEEAGKRPEYGAEGLVWSSSDVRTNHEIE